MLLRDIGPRQIEGPIADRHTAIVGGGPITVHVWDVTFSDEGAGKSDIVALLSREVVRIFDDHIADAKSDVVSQGDIRWHLSLQGRHAPPTWERSVRIARRVRPGVMWAAICPPGSGDRFDLKELHLWQIEDEGMAALYATASSALWESP